MYSSTDNEGQPPTHHALHQKIKCPEILEMLPKISKINQKIRPAKSETDLKSKQLKVRSI